MPMYVSFLAFPQAGKYVPLDIVKNIVGVDVQATGRYQRVKATQFPLTA